MKKTFSHIILVISFLAISACSVERNLEKNMSRIDDLYGQCDNPHRDFTKAELKICKDKLRANSGKGIDLEGLNISELIRGKGSNNIAYAPEVNPTLWKSAINKLESYSLKIADFDGGYIETDWIEEKNNNKRCLIKVQITEKELVSNGVKTNIVCQNKQNEKWINDNLMYLDESKRLTLAILENTKNIQQ